MTPRCVEQDGIRFLEGTPAETFIMSARDVTLLLEACFSSGTRLALLYGANLPPGFFDVSSREAGDVLQKLRMYGGVRLAVIRDGSTAESRRFGELLAAERRDGFFDVFDSRQAAVAWLQARSASVQRAGARGDDLFPQER